MDEHTLLVIMAVFVFVAALALVMQAVWTFGMYKASRALQQNVAKVAPKIEALADSSRITIEESRTQILAITLKTNQILASAEKQMARVDDLMADATERAHKQLAQAEAVVDDALSRAQDTVALVHGGIMKPLREVNGVVAGIRAALRFLARGGRPSPDQLTVDEEMFI
jgi:dihydroxyacetone kinase-like predicted kinase